MALSVKLRKKVNGFSLELNGRWVMSLRSSSDPRAPANQ